MSDKKLELEVQMNLLHEEEEEVPEQVHLQVGSVFGEEFMLGLRQLGVFSTWLCVVHSGSPHYHMKGYVVTVRQKRSDGSNNDLPFSSSSQSSVVQVALYVVKKNAGPITTRCIPACD